MTEFGAVGKGFSIEDPEVDNMFEAYNNDRSAYYVLTLEDRIVGSGGIAPLAGGKPSTCELKKMYFFPEARGFGWGKQLVSRLEQEAKARGFDTIYLETLTRMESANRLYQQAGFQKICGSVGNTGHCGCDSFYEKKV
jgi:putative acetyltransferase